MKKLKKTLLTIFISLILFVLGNIIYPSIFNLTLPKIDGVRFTRGAMNESFIPMLQFGISLGIIPALLLLVWNKASVESTNKKLLNIVIVLTSMALATIVRYQMLILHFKKIKKIDEQYSSISMPFEYAYPIIQLHYEYYVFCGLATGCLIAYFILRKKKEAFNTEVL